MPGATWEKWDMWNRQKNITNTAMNTWDILLLVDDDETVLRFLETAQTGYIECEDYGEIVKSGHGQKPTKEDVSLAMKNFLIIIQGGTKLIHIPFPELSAGHRVWPVRLGEVGPRHLLQ